MKSVSIWAKIFLQASLFENRKLKNFSFKFVPWKKDKIWKILSKATIKTSIKIEQKTTNKNVSTYGFRILINLRNHLPNSVKYSTAEGYFIKLENWKKFFASSSNVAISLACSICRKNRIISTLSLAKIPSFLSKN